MVEASLARATASGPLPSGTLAFLFTDIEGSTQRWEAAPQAMRAALARHDALLRAAIGAAGGHVFKTVGDAFCAAFPDATAAVAAALAAQRALLADGFPQTGGLRVRMAIHAGAAEARDGDYFGQPLNRVARLLGVGHGGQILLSGVAADLARGDLPPDMALRDLGRHRLKDLAEPEQILQLEAPDLPAEFPPLRSLAGAPNNLPQQVTAFIARESELAEIKALMAKHRLVTLVGAGGVGKTRSSLQVGAEMLERHPDGVWLVELAPLTDPQLVAESIAGIFGMSIAAGRSPVDTVVAFLKPKRTLLILDNCEHLVAAVAGLADAILRACPNVSILASSREPLAIAGESTYRMPSLGFPDRPEGITAEAALAHGAVRLFAERASAVIPGFVVADDNAPAVATICKRLDGVALAIELAVPRLKMLKPQELADRLHDRFRILTGGSRTALPRQQTLKALIDWSYTLLSEPEQTLLRRLSVFAGGWTLESATAVAAGAPVGEWEVFDLLASLVDKSLVVADASGRETRYRLLESTRQYAFEKLLDEGDAGRRRALATYVLAFYRKAEAAWPTTATGTWLASHAPDLDNLRASLEWAFGLDGDAALGLDLAGNALHLMLELNLLPEQARWFDIALARIDAQTPPAVAAQLWLGATHRFNQFNDPAGAEPARRAAALLKAIGDRMGEGMALARAGAFLMTNRRTAESAPLLEQALTLLQPLGRSKPLAACLHYAGVHRFFGGDHAAAREGIAEAAAMARALADRPGLRIILNSLAEVALGAGDAEAAVATIREVIADAAQDNDLRTLAQARGNLAAYSLRLDRIDEARTAAKDSVRDARSLGLSNYVANALGHLALIAGLTGQHALAARLFGYGAAWFAARGTSPQDTEQGGVDRLAALLADALPGEARARLMAEGAAWSEDEAAEEALKNLIAGSSAASLAIVWYNPSGREFLEEGRMRPLRHTIALAALAALWAVALGEPATAASKKLQDVLPYGRVPLDCLLTSSTPPARLSIRNSTTETIPAGRQIGWRTASGEHGAFLMPFSFDPGKIIGVGPGSGASCSAWMTLPTLQMSQ